MYDRIFDDVKRYLCANYAEETRLGHFPFRKRSDHIKRVFLWAKRLSEDPRLPCIDKDAVLTAALFHDVGYAVSPCGAEHAESSAAFFAQYALEHGYGPERTEFICYLIRNHSRKELLFVDGTPLELILLMEADLLDETGALSIVWDCMVEGAQDEQSFVKTYDHILRYSGKMLEGNPMMTEPAKEIWRKKQFLLREFLEQLAYDLGEAHAAGSVNIS